MAYLRASNTCAAPGARARRATLGTSVVVVVSITILLALAGGADAADVRAVDQEPITFAVIGDYGDAGRDAQAVADLVRSWDPAFIVTTGDNNYPDGAASTIDGNVGRYYHDFIGSYGGRFGSGGETNRFFPSLGNHDWETRGAAPYLAYFSLPGNERYYEVTQGPVHLFAVDSDPREPDGRTSSSTQAAWLRDTLASSTACWQLVYFHHPPYSSAEHGPTVEMRWPFREWGADAVFSGHDHTYERLNMDGLPYFVNGLGGRSRYRFKAPAPGSIVRYNGGYGAMRVTAYETEITYEFVTTAGAVVDSYTVTGGCATAGTPPNEGGGLYQR